jgi:hypothetical protein
MQGSDRSGNPSCDRPGVLNRREKNITMRRTVYAFALAAFVLLSSQVSFGAGQLGTAQEARAMLDRAVAALKDDKTAALKAFNDKDDKKFHDRDLYVYCFSMGDGKFTAYEEPFLLGADIRKLKLYGEPMGQQAFDLAHEAPEGNVVTIAYKMPKPGTKTPVAKEGLEARVGDQTCGVAYFK